MHWFAGQAFEQRGADKLDDANVISIVGGLLMIQNLDLALPEAAEIVTLLQGIPATLRYVLDHEVANIKKLGQTSTTFCALLTAHVFGASTSIACNRWPTSLVLLVYYAHLW